MKLIALTGGIGAGKTTVSAEFARLGAEVIDSDKISHEIMMPGGIAYNEVVNEFGEGILNSDKTINRKELAEIVFADNVKLKKLNAITHRLIYEEMKRLVELSTADVVCLEIPLLFTTDCPFVLDMKIAVVAPRELRILRLLDRDGCTREQADSRMDKQLSDDEFRKLADVIIENNGDINSVRNDVAEIYKQLLY